MFSVNEWLLGYSNNNNNNFFILLLLFIEEGELSPSFRSVTGTGYLVDTISQSGN